MNIVASLRKLRFRIRVAVIILVALAAVVVTLGFEPLPQPSAYHEFADERMIERVPNFANVVSNAGFALVGLLGLICLATGRAVPAASGSGARVPYVFFFAGLFFVAAGSGYYHYGPETETLYWDRVAMSFAFMSMYAAIISDRVSRLAGLLLLPILIFAGVAATTYWAMSELALAGDLRVYLLVQLIPALTIPLIILLFGDGVGRDRYLVAMLALYGTAMLLEHYDRAIFDAFGGFVSGHSLKHLVAAGAGYMVLHKVLTGRR